MFDTDGVIKPGNLLWTHFTRGYICLLAYIYLGQWVYITYLAEIILDSKHSSK
jgi:hypothetical protein